MIQFNPSLTGDSTVLVVLAAAVVIVFSLLFYVQRLLGKSIIPAVPIPAIRLPIRRSAKPVGGDRQANTRQ